MPFNSLEMYHETSGVLFVRFDAQLPSLGKTNETIPAAACWHKITTACLVIYFRTQKKSCLCTLGFKVSVVYVLGALGDKDVD